MVAGVWCGRVRWRKSKETLQNGRENEGRNVDWGF
uniref:Uncharacterized protein n=1 Tax=Nelumbo nucifera TaxID=4432 RepID=A0A822YL15_NELNU|nr:TPA_asm: hypothetical protein HUJ06_012048 [Nelumbo nucifera]